MAAKKVAALSEKPSPSTVLTHYIWVGCAYHTLSLLKAHDAEYLKDKIFLKMMFSEVGKLKFPGHDFKPEFVAKKCRVEQSTVSRWVRGVGSPSNHHVREFLHRLMLKHAQSVFDDIERVLVEMTKDPVLRQECIDFDKKMFDKSGIVNSYPSPWCRSKVSRPLK